MNGDLRIIPLSRSARDVGRFLRVSYGIYRDDPYWVAPLLMDLKKVFTDSNPLFEHAEVALWVAARNGRDVGRIAGILDRHYQQVRQDNAAFFGFFECANDAAASRALFEAVFAWARQRGARRVLGPMNPTMNDDCGLLVEGFDSPPVFMMTYNPRYYLDLVTAAGFRKAKDLLAFYMDFHRCPLDRLARIADKTRRRLPEITFTPVRRATFSRDLAKVKEVYNAAWQDNWGFVPMTDGEIDFMANRLKPLLVEGLIWIAETPQEPVGFMLALPDYNIALKPAVADAPAARVSAVLARVEMPAALPGHHAGREGEIPQPRSRSRDAHRGFQNGFQSRVQGRGSLMDPRRQPDDVPVARDLRR
jgi:hypothetical protein